MNNAPGGKIIMSASCVSVCMLVYIFGGGTGWFWPRPPCKN